MIDETTPPYGHLPSEVGTGSPEEGKVLTLFYVKKRVYSPPLEGWLKAGVVYSSIFEVLIYYFMHPWGVLQPWLYYDFDKALIRLYREVLEALMRLTCKLEMIDDRRDHRGFKAL